MIYSLDRVKCRWFDTEIRIIDGGPPHRTCVRIDFDGVVSDSHVCKGRSMRHSQYFTKEEAVEIAETILKWAYREEP